MRVMTWLAAIGTGYCVAMVALSLVPGAAPTGLPWILPAVAVAVLCLVVTIGVSFAYRFQVGWPALPFLILAAPMKVRIVGSSIAAGFLLTIVLTGGVHNIGNPDRAEGSQSPHLPASAPIGQRIVLGTVGWFLVIPRMAFAGAREIQEELLLDEMLHPSADRDDRP